MLRTLVDGRAGLDGLEGAAAATVDGLTQQELRRVEETCAVTSTQCCQLASPAHADLSESNSPRSRELVGSSGGEEPPVGNWRVKAACSCPLGPATEIGTICGAWDDMKNGTEPG